MNIKKPIEIAFSFLCGALLFNATQVVNVQAQDGGILEAAEKAAEMSKGNCETVCEDEADPSQWAKSVAFGFNLTDGNSNTLLLNLNAKLSRDYEDNIWNFEAYGNYGDSEVTSSSGEVVDERTQEDFKLETSYRRVLGERLYAGFTNEFYYDDIAGVDYRDTIFPHVGYFIEREEDFQFSVEAGPGYIFEKLEGDKNDYFAPRIGERIDWQISENAKFFEEASYTFDVDDSDNYIIEAEAGIEAAISSNLSLVFSVKDLYDNVPTEGRERNDLSVVTALQLNL